MTATDAMLSRFQAELEERRTFMDGLVEAAESAGRDLSAEEMDLYTRARDRMTLVAGQMVPLQEGAASPSRHGPAPPSWSAPTSRPAVPVGTPPPSSTAAPAPTWPRCTTRSWATRRPATGSRPTTVSPPIRPPPTTPV